MFLPIRFLGFIVQELSLFWAFCFHVSAGIQSSLSLKFGIILGALRIAKRPEMEGKNIVVLGASCGERYLSTPLAAQAASEVMDAVAEPL